MRAGDPPGPLVGVSERTSSMATAELPPANDAMRRDHPVGRRHGGLHRGGPASRRPVRRAPRARRRSRPAGWRRGGRRPAPARPPAGESIRPRAKARTSRLAGSISSLSSAVISSGRSSLRRVSRRHSPVRAARSSTSCVAQVDRRLQALPLGASAAPRCGRRPGAAASAVTRTGRRRRGPPVRGQDAHRPRPAASATGLLDEPGASGSGGAADRHPRRPAGERPFERRTDDVRRRRCRSASAGPSSEAVERRRLVGFADVGGGSSSCVIVMRHRRRARSPRQGDAVAGALGVGQDLVARCGDGHAQLLGVAGVVDRELVEHELAAAALQTPQLPRSGRLAVVACVARRRSCRRRSGRGGRARSRRRPRRGRADRTRRWRSRRCSDRRPAGCR